MRTDDLLRFTWLADPQISPDGRRIAFTHVTVDREDDSYRTAIWITELDAKGAPQGEPRPLTSGPRDSQPRWAPDAQWLVFVRAAVAGKPGQLHLLPMSGGEAEPLTNLEKGAASPAWSPDGRRLAFLSTTNPALDRPEPKQPKNEPARVVTRPMFRWNNEGFTEFDHLSHIWVLDVATARDAARARLRAGSAPDSGAGPGSAGAPGGVAEEIAGGATAGAAGPVSPAEDGPGTPRMLTRGEYAEGPPQWSRDGRWILFVSDRRAEPWFGEEDSDVFAVSPELAAPVDGEGMTVVADITGPIVTFAEGPNGRLAAIGGLREGPVRSYQQSKLLRFDGPWPSTRAHVLTAGYDFDFGSDDISSDQHPPRGGGQKPLAFSADGRFIFGVACRQGAARLARVDAASGAVEELTDAAHEVISGSATPDATRFALALGDVTRPADLCVYDVGRAQLVTVWSPNRELLEERGLGPVEEFWCASFDGTKIQGWIVKPRDFDPSRKYPLILQIHGGPHVAYGVGFLHEFRTLADGGYVVLYTNPRGSTTYGQEFGNIIQYKYPGDDYKDLMAAVDHVIGLGYVDESRMGVTGGSGGGLLTNWVIAQTHRFKAAITQRCVSDWASMWYSADFAMFTPSWFRKSPVEDPGEYQERSPFYLARQIRTPLMVIHSEEDWRTPIAQGEAMFRALKLERKPTVMVRFPGENHELSRSGAPSRRVQNQEHIRRWFDHWLMGIDAPEYHV